MRRGGTGKIYLKKEPLLGNIHGVRPTISIPQIDQQIDPDSGGLTYLPGVSVGIP